MYNHLQYCVPAYICCIQYQLRLPKLLVRVCYIALYTVDLHTGSFAHQLVPCRPLTVAVLEHSILAAPDLGEGQLVGAGTAVCCSKSG